MYIARVPVDQQADSLNAQHDWSVSKAENMKAQTDLQEVDGQLHQARNNLAAVKLQVDNALTAKKTADTSMDQNRINQAKKDLHTAEDVQKAAEAHVRYLAAYQHFLQRYFRYTQENMYAHEAAYENSKAQLAKQNNILIKDQQYDWYPKQADERNKRTQGSRSKSEGEKKHTLDARNEWLKLKQLAESESGQPTNAWDPMAEGASSIGNGAAPKPMLKTAPPPNVGAPAPLAPPPPVVNTPAPAPMPAPAPAPAPEPAPAPAAP